MSPQDSTASAREVIDGFGNETATHELRKAAYAGDLVERAKAMRAELMALAGRCEKFIRG